MTQEKTDFASSLKYDDHGLVPAVVQDAETNEVLMVGYMNAEAVRRTLATRRVTYWSRSREKFWIKGETSGHTQELVEMRTDCDKDCLLVRARQTGVACHDGYRSCFYRAVGSDGELRLVAEREVDPAAVYAR